MLAFSLALSTFLLCDSLLLITVGPYPGRTRGKHLRRRERLKSRYFMTNRGQRKSYLVLLARRLCLDSDVDRIGKSFHVIRSNSLKSSPLASSPDCKKTLQFMLDIRQGIRKSACTRLLKHSSTLFRQIQW